MTIGRVLNHARCTVTAKHYNQHAYLNEKARAPEAWDGEVQHIIRDEPKTRRGRPTVAPTAH